MLQISSSAIREIKRIQSNKQQPDIPLKISVLSGGCSGLFYELKFQNSHNSEDKLLQIDAVEIAIAPDAEKYIEDLKIDYAEDLMGGGFRFNNPQAENVCGCGISFSPKKSQS